MTESIFEFDPTPAEKVWLKMVGAYSELHPDPDQFQVPCEYANGAPCWQLYEQILDARNRLCERFGIDPEDRDLDIILSSYEEINQIFGIKMYQYGKKGIL